MNLGYDTYSITANPKFEGVKKYNFTLAEDSPAFNIGFKPINLKDVGA